MADTAIEWTRSDDGTPGAVWNPTTGCDRVSPGCDNCYALSYAKRLKGMGQAKYQTDGDPRTSGPGFGLQVHDDALALPLTWRKPRRVFVNSMSDLFHDRVPDEFIARVFAVMAASPQHTFQVLTKRHGRMRSLLNADTFHEQVTGHLANTAKTAAPAVRDSVASRERSWLPLHPWPLPNVWLGVSAEDQQRASLRVPALLDTPAAVRWLSCEPLLGEVNLAPEDHSGHARDWQGTHYECLACSTEDEAIEWVKQEMLPIDWLVIGGESGRGARPMDLDWARTLVRQCRSAEVPVFVKQLGSRVGPGKGGDINTWPEDLRVREYPQEVGS